MLLAVASSKNYLTSSRSTPRIIARQKTQNFRFFFRRLLSRSSSGLWFNSTVALPRPAVFTGVSSDIPVVDTASPIACSSPVAVPIVPSIAWGSMLVPVDSSVESTGAGRDWVATAGGGRGGTGKEAAGDGTSTTCWQWGQRTWPDDVIASTWNSPPHFGQGNRPLFIISLNPA